MVSLSCNMIIVRLTSSHRIQEPRSIAFVFCNVQEIINVGEQDLHAFGQYQVSGKRHLAYKPLPCLLQDKRASLVPACQRRNCTTALTVEILEQCHAGVYNMYCQTTFRKRVSYILQRLQFWVYLDSAREYMFLEEAIQFLCISKRIWTLHAVSINTHFASCLHTWSISIEPGLTSLDLRPNLLKLAASSKHSVITCHLYNHDILFYRLNHTNEYFFEGTCLRMAWQMQCFCTDIHPTVAWLISWRYYIEALQFYRFQDVF